MFHELISDVANRMKGLQNVILAATDGITVSKLAQRDEDELMVVEAANLVRDCHRFGAELESGELKHLVFAYGEKTVVIQMVNDEYFLMGICSKENWTGKLKYLLRVKSLECHNIIE
ncbi:MAG: roadblock/LC7 domain-containing protein [Acidobacteria bacterium]|nr:roadblock/LC7 domain-containing protein [Acidobacteriota bacterium]